MSRNLLTLCACCLLIACANSPTPHYDARFGDAVREARQRMTINPMPAAQADAAGMDGRSAREAVLLYQESFRTPPPVVNVINLGGTGAK